MIVIGIADHSVQFRKELESQLAHGKVAVALSTSNGPPFIEGLRKASKITVVLVNYQLILPATLKTAAAVREHFPSIKIIVTTAHNHVGLCKDLIELGYEGLWKQDRLGIQNLLSIIHLVHQGYRCFPDWEK